MEKLAHGKQVAWLVGGEPLRNYVPKNQRRRRSFGVCISCKKPSGYFARCQDCREKTNKRKVRA